MRTINAVAIEHTLARFFQQTAGTRGQCYDADVFHAGQPKQLADMLQQVADTLHQRIAFLPFRADGPGTPKALLESSVTRIRELAEVVGNRPTAERENYHWEIFGALMGTVVGLLETLEAQMPVQ